MTAIQSILLHLDSAARCDERTRLAHRLASTFAATVAAVYSVVPSMLRYPMGLDGPAGVLGLDQYDDECRRRANRLFMDAGMGSDRMRWEVVAGDAIGEFERRAFYADLVVLGQRPDDAALAAETPADFVPRLIVHSGRPCLVVPSSGAFPVVGRTVVIAWKQTREAAHAVAASLPWLRRAEVVHAIAYGEDASDALMCLQAYLQAHHVRVALHPDHGRDVDVGEDLLSRSSDLGADLLVMGCYGHSRAREWVLGGVSRSMLRAMTLPVLMAH
jgi:nucleotide-binding universal stress UspA family protein